MAKTHRKRYRLSAGEQMIHRSVSRRRTRHGWGTVPGLREGCRRIFGAFETEYASARKLRNRFRSLGGNPYKRDRRGGRTLDHAWQT